MKINIKNIVSKGNKLGPLITHGYMTEECLEAFVRRRNGTKVIKRILIANNGIAAVKEIRSIRRWCYETFRNERAIQFIAMATPEDLKANAEYIKMADEYVSVPGGRNNNNYANVELIIDLAQRYKADAVWCGWGHASENPKLPERLNDDIVFIGPPASAMRSLGDKISSTIVAQSANVPTIPWSGSEIRIDVSNGVDVLDQEIFDQGTVHNAEQGLQMARKIGFPLMIKASEGGGGKGIRKVESEETFKDLFHMVQKEVVGSPIFLMKLANNARHLEVQLLSDNYGDSVAIFGRDCSIQRRHQKIIEEAPVTIASPKDLEEMEQAAVRLSKIVGYVSTGTVEYLYDLEKKSFYFLELNPRLQVEHPTTEMISKVNLPAAQLLIAMGIPLHCIPDIRALYNEDPNEISKFQFSASKRKQPRGHVIAARITAENPDSGFKPSGGKVTELTLRSSRHVWGYFSVGPSGGIHEFADSQFGHVFAYGKTRHEARNNMVIALNELSIRGDFRTTIEYLVKLLETDIFIGNSFNTAWLDTLIANKFTSEKPDPSIVVLCGAVCKSYLIHENQLSEMKRLLDRGQLPTANLTMTTHSIKFIYLDVQYTFNVAKISPNVYRVFVNDSSVLVSAIGMSDESLLIQIGGKSYITFAKEDAANTRLIINGKTCLLDKDHDPSLIRTLTPGKLMRFMVKDGEHVDAGTSIAEVEVMKMYMPLISNESGVVKLLKPVGSIIETGETIAVLKLDNPGQAQKIKKFSGEFDSIGHYKPLESNQRYRLQEALDGLYNVFDGFEVDNLDKNVETFFELSCDPKIPVLELNDILSNYSGRFSHQTEKEINSLLLEGNVDFEEIKRIILKHPEVDSTEIIECIDKACSDRQSEYVLQFMNAFLEVESYFDKRIGIETIITQLRETFKDDFYRVVRIIWSHSKLESKIICLCKILDRLRSTPFDKSLYLASFKKLSSLESPEYAKIVLKAREIMLFSHIPSIQDQKKEMENRFLQVIAEKGSVIADREFINTMVGGSITIIDALPLFFHHENELIRNAALEIYVRRTFSSYALSHMKHTEDCLVWTVGKPQHQRSKSLEAHILDSPNKTLSRTHGVMSSCMSLETLKDSLSVIENFPLNVSEDMCSNVLYLALPPTELDDTKVSLFLSNLFHERAFKLRTRGIQRITVIIIKDLNTTQRYFTFVESQDFAEESTIRHIEPGMAYHLEFIRLSNYHLQFCHVDPNAQIHIYLGTFKSTPKNQRLFTRVLVRPNQSMREMQSIDFFLTEGSRLMENVIEAVQNAYSLHKCENNHLFINVLPIFHDSAQDVSRGLTLLREFTVKRLMSLKLTEVEIKIGLSSAKGQRSNYRFIFNNESGYVLTVSAYKEVKDSSGECILESIDPIPGDRHMTKARRVYPPIDPIQEKRINVKKFGTTYVYDFPLLFKHAVEMIWKQIGSQNKPETLMKVQELFLDDSGKLVALNRDPGLNTHGMVAWLMTLYTPEAPSGRDIVVIANDMTFQIGSFGLEEDELFFKASKYARELGIPRIYLSANSGARIGMAEEVKSLFQVAWKNEKDLSLGFDYLYLSPEDYEKVKGSVSVEKIGNRFKITDIIGAKNGIGVENLQGSGLLAGETSKCYEEVFTLTFVTSRTVGIGAYLVRLGQRTIQKHDQPIILTGIGALNKVLGRNIYNSNLQIGGPQIMHANGVTHRVVKDDLQGVSEILDWLSFVPFRVGTSLPILVTGDSVERRVEIKVHKSEDPRHMLTGKYDESGYWVSGLFDKDSFREYLAGWARTVIVGRARLGGIPVGVIAVETRTVDVVIPADPANPASEEQIKTQAGQVWYPDSAFKTAQAIRDFNNGEQLPLMILANWRGFSGGQRDMQEEILKYGAHIVDALKDYKQPVFVYLPPESELRGGAWVVLDSKINPEHIEMFADPTSRGGILEPDGASEIKYRKTQILKTMERHGVEESKYQSYRQVATKFADLHDTPGRMLEKKVITAVVPFEDSRRYFHTRLCRRLHESALVSLFLKSSYTPCSMEYSRQVIESNLSEWCDVDWKSLSDLKAVSIFESRNEELKAKVLKLALDYRVSFLVSQMADLTAEEKERVFSSLE